MTASSNNETDSWAYRALRAALHDVAGRLGVLRLAADLAAIDETEIASFHRIAIGSLDDLDEWLHSVRALLQLLERPPGPPAACDVTQVARQVLSSAGGDTALEQADPAVPHAGQPPAVALVMAALVRELRRALPAGRITVSIRAEAETADAPAPTRRADPGPPPGVTTIRCSGPANDEDLSAGAVSPLILSLCTEVLGRQGGTVGLCRGSANEFTVEIRLPLWGRPGRPD